VADVIIEFDHAVGIDPWTSVACGAGFRWVHRCMRVGLK
jgi:hypothetical protein